jgi:4-amino-4-deoxy-L-arabinose transferase-like glycosyltransferase
MGRLRGRPWRLPDGEAADAWLDAGVPRRPARAAWLVPFLLFTALRLPSFFEPHWYTDEAGYATAARAVLQGRVLYSGIWTNKPPLQIWAVAAAVRLFGYGEAGLHAFTFGSGMAAVAAVAWIARRLLPTRRALLCVGAMAVLLGLPFFDAELALPESFLVAPATWSGALVLESLRTSGSRRWPWTLGAGVLIGVALGYQQTELADAGAFGLALLIAPETSAADVIAYVAAGAGTTLAWLVPAVWLAGVRTVASALIGFYGQYAAASARGPAGLAVLALGVVAVLAGAVVERRLPAMVWLPWLWAGADLGVAALIHRPYPHLLLPAVAPAVLAGASLPAPRVRRLPLLAGALVLALLASSSGVESEALLAYGTWYRQLVAAAALPPRSLMGAVLGPQAAADAAATRFIRTAGLAGCPAVVWSADAWPYLTADLSLELPTAPIYNDIELEGQPATVARVRALSPPVIVVSRGAIQRWSRLQPLLRRRYSLAYTREPVQVYVLRGRGSGC